MRARCRLNAEVKARVPGGDKERLQRMAGERRLGVAGIVREALREFIDRQQKSVPREPESAAPGDFPDKLVDLQPFCHAADGTHPLLESPWSLGSWTYATDGSILGRVPKRGHAAKSFGPPGVSELFKRHL